jgi:hypothetical protein
MRAQTEDLHKTMVMIKGRGRRRGGTKSGFCVTRVKRSRLVVQQEVLEFRVHPIE